MTRDEHPEPRAWQGQLAGARAERQQPEPRVSTRAERRQSSDWQGAMPKPKAPACRGGSRAFPRGTAWRRCAWPCHPPTCAANARAAIEVHV